MHLKRINQKKERREKKVKKNFQNKKRYLQKAFFNSSLIEETLKRNISLFSFL